ncbi:transglutaminase-like domain-containing protein [Clostridium sp.]|uniref:transglutaminase-like domain-containing protein n=1 Tax=Clostridium sp. TaxID=1506 RepID=UPI00399414FA
MRKKYESLKQYEYACENSSWNNLNNAEENMYLKPYGINVDKQYREYKLESNGEKLYNIKNYSPDETNLLNGSNYNTEIMYAAYKTVMQQFLIRKGYKLEYLPEVEVKKKLNEIVPKEEFISSEYNNIYSYVKENIPYDKALSNQMNKNDVTGQVNQSAIAIFNNKKGVCEGMSELYAAMCRSVGLPVKIVIGTYDNGKVRSEGHAWNEVFINGKWEIFDVAGSNIKGNYVNYKPEYVLEFR